MTEKEWLEERKKGIGGSDAAAIIAKNPWKNNVELWEEKTGKREIKDLSDNPNVTYGKEMEAILRESFKIKYPQYEVLHEENSIIKHSKYPFLFASLDGILIDKQTGEMGVLEIKTANIVQSMQKEKWSKGVPDNYFCQCLHYLNVTNFTFAKVFAELKYNNDYYILRTYDIDRNEHEDDIKYLEKQEIEFWKNYVEKDIRPPLELPQI